jgi:RNA polymerase sigma-70 factor (ECF subfamily)
LPESSHDSSNRQTADASSVPTDREQSSFDQFFLDSHGQMVRALALALGDVELARDAAAEGFTRALRHWRKVSRYDNPGGWVYRVGVNWGRSRLRKSTREVTSGVAAGLAGSAGRADHRLVEGDQRDLAVAEALAGLNPDHRDVIVGKYWFDWSEQQLAAALDIAPGTVKSRLSRALAQLSTNRALR